MLMAVATFILQTSCTKDLKNSTILSKPTYAQGVVFNFGGKTASAAKGEATQTILGELKANPNNSYPPNWAYKCVPPPPSGVCVSTGNIKKPFGQITVDDTQLSTAGNPSTFDGVRDIKVIIVDGLNFWNHTFVSTNDNGCWSSDKKMWKGAYFWAKFNSIKCTVRGLKHNYNIITWPLSFSSGIISYIGKVKAGSFYNIQANYNRTTNNTTNDHLYWSAATVNNAVHEFHDYAIQEGINIPPNSLKIFINPVIPGGAALMASHFTTLEIDNWAQSLTTAPNWINLDIGQLLDNPVIRICFIGLVQTIKGLNPDILIGTTTNNSDILKRMVYHEVAHSSHFTKAGKPFWFNVIVAESNAFLLTGDPHGNAAFADADIIAVAESWAEHVAKSFSHMNYGNSTSLPVNIPNYNWFLENQRNEDLNHIPIGIYHDLIDGINIYEAATDGIWLNGASGIIYDHIYGINNSQMFSLLNQNITSPTDFINSLINSGYIQAPNISIDATNLFNSY